MRVVKLVFIFFVCGGMAFAQKSPIVKIYGKGAGGYYFLHIKKFILDSTTKTPAPVQLILDGSGNIIFYRTIENASDFKVYPNGMMSFFYQKNYYLMDSAFRIIDSVSCVNGIKTDNHEFQILPNGNYLLLGTEETEMDLSSFPIFLHRGIKGSSRAKVITGVVQELNAKKELVYEWRSKTYFDIQKADTFFLNDTLLVDMTHFNSVAVTPDSNWLVSVRYYNEVIKVNRKNGSIIWRLGGQNNQFALQGDSVFFLAQHDARELKPGIISLFD
ncbi:MAG: aryl-sulfate sulfotransferase, partial [Bacteroidia bacterium]|nr:aryl-sulfate sulfotransferase [Bacteroidia bacterium]